MTRQVKAWRKLIWSWQWRNALLNVLLLQHLFAVKRKWLFMIPTVLELRSAAGARASAELLCGVGFPDNNEQDAAQMFCYSGINGNRLIFWFLKSKNTILAKAVWVISNMLKNIHFFWNYISESNSIAIGTPPGDQVWAFFPKEAGAEEAHVHSWVYITFTSAEIKYVFFLNKEAFLNPLLFYSNLPIMLLFAQFHASAFVEKLFFRWCLGNFILPKSY